MLSLSGISKAYAGRVLFEDSTLQVTRPDRIGLVGPNGAGKSTLFSIILGDESADRGEIARDRYLTIGHLPQEQAVIGDETVLELATAISPEYTRLRRTLEAWAADHPGEENPGVDHPDGDVHERFETLGGYRLEARAKQMLAGLGFRTRDCDRPARQMSGGWVMRAHLARLLTVEPDLLMLDEPTNHLDLEALLWLQNYLKSYAGAILVISHDREFLNQLVGSVVEIRQGKLLRYRGNYDAYLEQREAAEEQLLAAYKNQQRDIARLMEFVNRFRAKNTKAKQAQSKLKQIGRMELIEAPAAGESSIDFQFPQPQRSGLRVIKLDQVHYAYGENVVYRGLDFEAERGQRVVLVGPNGAGKSTLLKLLAGVLPPQSGAHTLGHNVRAGYYSQSRVEMLKPERAVLEEALDTPQRVTEQFVRTLLGCFLFRGDDVFKQVSVLSGGEKSRLALVKLLLDPPNLLLMDEPTTHLDMSSIDALAYALDQFQGTLIFISHDVYFIRALANRVVHVDAGKLTHYSGDYAYYVDKTQPVNEREGLTARASSLAAGAGQAAAEIRGPSQERRDQRRLLAEQRQARSRQCKAQREIVTGLEKQIAQLEVRQAEVTVTLQQPETYRLPGRGGELNRELNEIRERLATMTRQWEEQAHRLADLESS